MPLYQRFIGASFFIQSYKNASPESRTRIMRTEISCAIHYTKDALYFYFSAFIKKIKIICQFYLESTNTDDAYLFPLLLYQHFLS